MKKRSAKGLAPMLKLAMTVEKLIEEELAKVEKALEYARKKLKKMPDCSLQIRNERGYKKYVCISSTRDVKTKYITHDEETVALLEEKGYLEKLEKTALKEKTILTRIQTLYKKKTDFEKVFLKIPKDKRHLIKPYEPLDVAIDKKRFEIWMEKPRSDKETPKEQFITKNGERVRSKSELIIADRLYIEGIPYHYEAPLMLADEYLGQFFEWYPDFKVLNTRTGKEYYWEHFGRMDDKKYCASALGKLETYAENGIFEGENLIVTMETSERSLNTQYVDLLIKKYLK